MWDFLLTSNNISVIFQGEEGVREVLQILNDEFRLSMALSGKSDHSLLILVLVLVCNVSVKTVK